MIESKPKITVIIPTCHRNDLLAKCLDCLAPGVQTLPVDQYEIIVSDDGSKSTAEAMVTEQYPWVRWVGGPRRGPAANRNNGAKYAIGEWLAFTDDDCLPDVLWLEAFASSKTRLSVLEGKTICRLGIRSALEHAPINIIGGGLYSCNFAVKNDLFEQIGGFDENFPYPHMEDTDFRDRLNATKNQILFVQEAVVDHPPRRLPSGNQLAKTQESQVMYMYKYNKPQAMKTLFLNLLKVRLRAIINHRFSLDTIKAVISLAVECSSILLHFAVWKRKYTTLYSVN